MSERSLWKNLRSKMSGRWTYQRVEDKLAQGIPDIWCKPNSSPVSGWIELKFRESFPKRSTTVVRLAHFSLAQRRWLTEKATAGVPTLVLLQVGTEWFLFDGAAASDHLGIDWKEADLRTHSIFVWAVAPGARVLESALTASFLASSAVF